MSREVIIENTTFIINSFSGDGAAETLEELLERVIVQNAETELKKHPSIGADDSPELS